MKTLAGMDFSDEAYVKSTLWSMLGFLVLYFSSYKILRKKLVCVSSEYECRLITLFHGLIACFVATYYVVLPALDYYKIASIPSTLILTHSMGFFFFDLCWCFIHGESPVMKFHHLLTVTGLFYYSFRIEKQFYIVFSLGLTEITNPFLQVRWFLKHHGQRQGLPFKIVEGILILLFFVIRVFIISYYAFEAYINKEHGFERDDLTFTALGVLTGYALAIQMFNYICYQLKKSRNKKET